MIVVAAVCAAEANAALTESRCRIQHRKPDDGLPVFIS
jgi:hypothetical protein